MSIINNHLPWDGTHLGQFQRSVITLKWKMENVYYYEMTLPQGIIYCNLNRTADALPCIVDEIKPIFGLPKRGIHRITLARSEYVLYYIPITDQNEIIWETPISKLSKFHSLRKNPEFTREICKAIVFCELLSLNRTFESSIRLRPREDTFEPIIYNGTKTELYRHDLSILSKKIFTIWFGENIDMSDVVRDMVRDTVDEQLDAGIKITCICANVRAKIDKIVKKYDSRYIWYSNFIIERMSTYLLR